VRDLLAAVRHALRGRRLRANRRLLDWIDPLAGTDEIRRRTPEDVALANAADSPGEPVEDAYYASEEELAALEAEGAFDEPVELTPELQARLDATRDELVGYAHRVQAKRKARRRVRRQRVLVLASTMLLTLAVAAGAASALISGSTGLAAVDRLLGIYEAGLPDPARDDRSPRSRTLPNVEPRPGASTLSVAVPHGLRKAVGTVYPSVGGHLCFVLALSYERADKPIGGRTCTPLSHLTRGLARRPALIEGVTALETAVVAGYAAADVESLSIVGPGGKPLRVRLSDPWTPDVPGARSLRVFVGTYSPDLGPNGLDGRELREITDHGSYRISVRFENGRTAELAP
jgi:hypothetical protein